MEHLYIFGFVVTNNESVSSSARHHAKKQPEKIAVSLAQHKMS